jgi:hypothetical protein
MKKFFVVFMISILVLSMSLPVFASLGSFISSPSGNQAPEIIEAENRSKKCESVISVTAYANRDQLSEESRAEIEAAYATIKSTEDVLTLNASIADYAAEAEVGTYELAVSDLFDISHSDCPEHDKHKHFEVAIATETMDKFVCLLHYKDGEWTVVDGAKLNRKKGMLEFETDEFSPFAIVVSVASEPVVKDNTALIVAVSVGTPALGAGTWLTVTNFDKIKKLFKLKKKI